MAAARSPIATTRSMVKVAPASGPPDPPPQQILEDIRYKEGTPGREPTSKRKLEGKSPGADSPPTGEPHRGGDEEGSTDKAQAKQHMHRQGTPVTLNQRSFERGEGEDSQVHDRAKAEWRRPT
jgi:hypothetical protein